MLDVSWALVPWAGYTLNNRSVPWWHVLPMPHTGRVCLVVARGVHIWGRERVCRVLKQHAWMYAVVSLSMLMRVGACVRCMYQMPCSKWSAWQTSQWNIQE